MSTYLVAFIVGEIETQSPKNSFIRVWSQPHLLHQTAYANELAPKILKFFENYFNISFPLPKIDIVAVPEFGFSAMENWGLITFRESSLLYDPTTTTIEQETSIALVLGHEIAHQWFGNLVTPKWWNDLWLKEGFSTYLEYLGISHVRIRSSKGTIYFDVLLWLFEGETQLENHRRIHIFRDGKGLRYRCLGIVQADLFHRHKQPSNPSDF